MQGAPSQPHIPAASVLHSPLRLRRLQSSKHRCKPGARAQCFRQLTCIVQAAALVEVVEKRGIGPSLHQQPHAVGGAGFAGNHQARLAVHVLLVDLQEARGIVGRWQAQRSRAGAPRTKPPQLCVVPRKDSAKAASAAPTVLLNDFLAALGCRWLPAWRSAMSSRSRRSAFRAPAATCSGVSPSSVQ